MKGCFVRLLKLSQRAAHNENKSSASELDQQCGVVAAKPETLSSVPWIHMVERKNWFLQVVLQTPHIGCGTCLYTQTQSHTHKVNKQL